MTFDPTKPVFTGKLSFQSTNPTGPKYYLSYTTSGGETVPTLSAMTTDSTTLWTSYDAGGGAVVLVAANGMYLSVLEGNKLAALVVDADKAVIQIENFLQATSQLAQTTLRSVLGKHTLDEMLSERDKLNADIQAILDMHTEAWGVKVTNVEIKQVDLDHSMVRAIARQAEAERLRRAKIINAEGEQQAAQKLVEAAEILAARPGAMQLRYLGTLSEIASERSSTIVFPFPLDLMQAFRTMADAASPRDATGR